MKSNKSNYLSLTHFFSKVFFLGIGFSKILTLASESTIFSLIFGTVIGSVIIILINKLNFRTDNKLRNIIMFIILYIFFIIIASELINMISNVYLMNTNKYLILFPLLLTILYLNTKDIEVHFKISNILHFIDMIIFTTCFLCILPQLKILNYLPIFNTSIKNVWIASLEFALYSSIPNILFGGINYNYEDREKDILKNYIKSSILLIMMFLIIQGAMGIELINLFKYPEYIVLKRINLFNTFNNLENIFSFIWIFLIYIYLSISSKEMYDISNKFFNNKKVYPIFLILSMYFISSYLYDNQMMMLYLYKYLWLIFLIILFVYILTNLVSLKKEK